MHSSFNTLYVYAHIRFHMFFLGKVKIEDTGFHGQSLYVFS